MLKYKPLWTGRKCRPWSDFMSSLVLVCTVCLENCLIYSVITVIANLHCVPMTNLPPTIAYKCQSLFLNLWQNVMSRQKPFCFRLNVYINPQICLCWSYLLYLASKLYIKTTPSLNSRSSRETDLILFKVQRPDKSYNIWCSVREVQYMFLFCCYSGWNGKSFGCAGG